ncbi:MAG: lipopolysaccharide biosynthesis protein, partial [Devosia sp.]|nr:lipopolysaccharide biosynthesis protein [Devosia sp.]
AREVTDIEKRVQAYKTQNLEALPDSLEFRRDQQIKMQSRLRELEREEATLTSRRANYLQYYSATGRVSDDAPQSPEFRLLQDLQAALATQRSTFEEDSPAITSLQARIAAVESHLRAEPTTPAAAAKPAALDMQLAEIDERLQAIVSERQSIEKSYARLTASIEATPANEAGLSALQRDYANAQTLYSAAMARLAEASIGEQIEARFKGERLALIEDAQPPDHPVRPKRFMIAAGGAAAGLVAALAAVAGLEFLNAKVRRPIELQRKLGIDPLATIPFIPSAQNKSSMMVRWLPAGVSARGDPK